MQNYLPIPVLSVEETTAASNVSHAVLHGVTLFSTVICFNRGGRPSSLSSDGVTLLPEAPISSNAFLSISSPAPTPYVPRQGYVPTTAATLRWDGFEEPAETPLQYQLRLLEGGTGNQANWTDISFAKMISLHELQVPENATHVIQIRAVNLGGVVSSAIQSSLAIVSSPPEDTGEYCLPPCVACHFISLCLQVFPSMQHGHMTQLSILIGQKSILALPPSTMRCQ